MHNLPFGLNGILPKFFKVAGLFNMLSDSSHEIRQQADSALSEFLQEIKNSPVRPSLSSKYFFKIIYCEITLEAADDCFFFKGYH